MGFFDRVMSTFKITDDDEYEDDDYNDEEENDDEYEYEDDRPKKKLFSGAKKGRDVTEEEDLKIKKNDDNSSQKIITAKFGPRGLELVVVKPDSMDASREITDILLAGKAVVLNLEGLPAELAQRIVDYTSGSCYTIDGNLQRVTKCILLATPPNVDISGDVREIPEQLATGGLNFTSLGKG